MKKFYLIFVLFFGLVLSSFAQERRLKTSFQCGPFKGGDYKRVQAGIGFGFEMSYFFSEKFLLTAHFKHGTNDYYEDVYTKIPNQHLTLNLILMQQ